MNGSCTPNPNLPDIPKLSGALQWCMYYIRVYTVEIACSITECGWCCKEAWKKEN